MLPLHHDAVGLGCFVEAAKDHGLGGYAMVLGKLKGVLYGARQLQKNSASVSPRYKGHVLRGRS